MLLGCQCRNTHRQCHDHGTYFISCRNIFLFPNPYDAEPAYQTMNRWKQIARRVHFVNNTHQNVPYRISFYYRTHIRGRQYQKTDQAYCLCHHFCTNETVHFFFLLSCCQYIIGNPEQITAQINAHRPGYKWNLMVDSQLKIIMGPVSRQEHGSTVNKLIPYHNYNQWNDRLRRNQRYFLFSLHMSILFFFLQSTFPASHGIPYPVSIRWSLQTEAEFCPSGTTSRWRNQPVQSVLFPSPS